MSGGKVQHYQAPSGARIHISTDEQAGTRALARGGPKPREHELWSFLATEFRYQEVLDLGANYGQVSLASTYPSSTEIALVEPNIELHRYIERSIETHPNSSQIALHGCALGDRDGEANLFIRREAVGKSSLIKEQGDAVQVPVRTLDSLVPPSPDVLEAIIKVDVEGSELAVLRGARTKLASLQSYAIMIELHPGYMRTVSGSLGQYLESLCEYGNLWELREVGSLRPFDFSGFVRRGKLHDILIISGDMYAQTIRDFNRGIAGSPVATGVVPKARRRLRGAIRKVSPT